MKDPEMTPDDPRLTAYALGELSDEETAEVAAAIERNPELAREVADIRAMAGGLEAALGAEALPEAKPVEVAEQIEFPLGRRQEKRFPYFWISGLAAAGFAVLVLVQSPESPLVGRETTIVSPRPIPAASADSPTQAPVADEGRNTRSADANAFAANNNSLPMAAETTELVESNHVQTDDGSAFAAPAAAMPDAVEPSVSMALPQVEVALDQPLKDKPPARDQGAQDPEVMTAVDTVVASSEVLSEETRPMELSAVERKAEKETREGAAAPSAKMKSVNRVSSPFLALRMAAALSLKSPEDSSTEGYASIVEQGWQRVLDHPLSTFAVDVDSASYANVRRFLRSGKLPPQDAVKVEELVNAFTYDYAGPVAGDDAPLKANLEVAAAPWNEAHRLVRIGLKAEAIPATERGAANLVFLLDVSGSMNSPRKLPLVKEAMRLLLGQLREDDRVAIVTYAGSSGLALPSTAVRQRGVIERALENLRSGGSTNGAMGIHLAYDIAKANFVPDGINRVILCTDGDFNVGTTGLHELGQLITAKAQSDVFLTALGFGMGNYQDDTLAQLANQGNGHHGYIDSVREARRLLVEQVQGTLHTVARDVKIQVEFNPAQVDSYRLIGYDGRRLAPEEFNDDAIDAGEIGAGHTVTALYEVIPVGREGAGRQGTIDELRYQALRPSRDESPAPHGHEMLTVKLRAQPPEGGPSRKWEFPLVDAERSFDRASPDFKFAAAVAGFGLVLRDHPSVESTSLAQVEGWARSGITNDAGGYRQEFLELVSSAADLAER